MSTKTKTKAVTKRLALTPVPESEVCPSPTKRAKTVNPAAGDGVHGAVPVPELIVTPLEQAKTLQSLRAMSYVERIRALPHFNDGFTMRGSMEEMISKANIGELENHMLKVEADLLANSIHMSVAYDKVLLATALTPLLKDQVKAPVVKEVLAALEVATGAYKRSMVGREILKPAAAVSGPLIGASAMAALCKMLVACAAAY